MTKKTPEQRSLDRYPDDAPPYGVVYPNEHKRDGYATCIREEVVPLEEENAKLRALVQELATALERCVNENGEIWGGEIALVAKAKELEQGFVPTNTEDK